MTGWPTSDWRDEVAAQNDERALHFRSLACFELANDFAEKAHQYRSRSQFSLRIREFPLHERIVLSRSDSYEWDQLHDAGVELEHKRPHGPERDGSRYCQSGSIASGGHRTYCTCSTCW